MKIEKLNEEIYGADGKVLKTDDEIETDIKAQEQKRVERSSDILEEIQKKLKDKSYKNRDELKNDVVALFKKWQENK